MFRHPPLRLPKGNLPLPQGEEGGEVQLARFRVLRVKAQSLPSRLLGFKGSLQRQKALGVTEEGSHLRHLRRPFPSAQIA